MAHRTSILSVDLTLVLSFFIVGLASISIAPLWGSSEAREVHIAWTLLHGGDWILPSRDGIVASKPPLFHWLTAIIAAPFGTVLPVHARFVSLVAASIIILRTMKLGRALVRVTSGLDLPHQTDRAAFIIWFVLVTTYGFIANAVDAKVDMLFACFVTLSVCGFLEYWMRQPNTIQSWRSLFGWSAFAVLTKGPLGFVLPTLIAFSCTALVVGFKESCKFFCIPRTSLLFFALPVAWYLLAAQAGGDPFIGRQLFFENVQRFSGGEKINQEAWWFYGPSFLRTTAPWGILFLFYLAKKIKHPETVLSRYAKPTWQWVGVLWLIIGLTFFSIASGKRHSYVLPLLPGLAVTLGVWAGERGARVSQNVWRYCVITLGITFFALVTVLHELSAQGGIFFGDRSDLLIAAEWIKDHRLHSLVSLALLSIPVMVIGVKEKFRREESGPIFVGFFASTILFFVYTTGIALKGNYKAFEMNALKILEEVGKEKLTVVKSRYDEYFDPILYYLYRDVVVTDSLEVCEGFILSNAETFSELENTHHLEKRLNLGPRDREEIKMILSKCRDEASGV